MKKVLLLLISAALALSITACSRPAEPAGEIQSSSQSATSGSSSHTGSSATESSESQAAGVSSSQLDSTVSTGSSTQEANTRVGEEENEGTLAMQADQPQQESVHSSAISSAQVSTPAAPSAPSQEVPPPSVKPESSTPPSEKPPVVVPPVSSAPAASSQPVPPSSAPSTGSRAQQVAALVNQERAKVGLAPLTLDTELSANADIRAKEIVTKFDHTRPDGSKFYSVITIPWRTVGENIAWGQKSPEAVMNSWMNSEGHRANILKSSFNKIGVGVYETNGRLYWVQLFAG